MEIVAAMTVDCDVRAPGIVIRRLHTRDPQPFRHAGKVRSDIRPRLAAIAGDLHIAVVRARPNQVAISWRLGKSDDRVVVFRERAGGGHRLRSGIR